jgi:hypothetical protein
MVKSSKMPTKLSSLPAKLKVAKSLNSIARNLALTVYSVLVLGVGSLLVTLYLRYSSSLVISGMVRGQSTATYLLV